MTKIMDTYHVVYSVVHRFNNLSFPFFFVLYFIKYVVDINSSVELLRPDPLEEHGLGVLAGQVDDDGRSRRADICPNKKWIARFTFILRRVRSDPNLVLRVRV